MQNSCNTGKIALPDTYAPCLRAEGICVHIRQSGYAQSACVATL